MRVSLGGGDWLIRALDFGTAAKTGRGFKFLVAISLDGGVEPHRIEAAFRAFCGRLPALAGRLARVWPMSPCWSFDVNADGAACIGFNVAPMPPDRAGFVAAVGAILNARAAESRTVALDVLTGAAADGESALCFTFSHALFDATGAERFIDRFFRFSEGDAEAVTFSFAEAARGGAARSGLRARLLEARNAGRFARGLSGGSRGCLPVPPDARDRPFRFGTLAFNAEEAERLKALAWREAGYLMLGPYLLACALGAFAGICRTGDRLGVSVSTALPTDGADSGLFFNRLSFLYFQCARTEAADRRGLTRLLCSQLARQTRAGIPLALEQFNRLMRALPSWLFWRYLLALSKGRPASFGFSLLGTLRLQTATAFGCPVLDVEHFPLPPVPPGIGLVLTAGKKGYHATLSYLDGTLDEAAAAAFLNAFRAAALAEGGGTR